MTSENQAERPALVLTPRADSHAAKWATIRERGIKMEGVIYVTFGENGAGSRPGGGAAFRAGERRAIYDPVDWPGKPAENGWGESREWAIWGSQDIDYATIYRPEQITLLEIEDTPFHRVLYSDLPEKSAPFSVRWIAPSS